MQVRSLLLSKTGQQSLGLTYEELHYVLPGKETAPLQELSSRQDLKEPGLQEKKEMIGYHFIAAESCT